MQLRNYTLFLPMLALSCGGEEDLGYEPATLQAYLAAIPAESRLVAGVPTADPEPGALTSPGNAVLAREGVKFARTVNEPARLIVRALRAVVELPPTFFDSEKRQFVWGPWENDQGVGDVLVYIQQNADGEDFEYSYALARTMGGDVATATPVIWGAATPDPDDEDRGVGVTLWDLEANHAFELEHSSDPAAEPNADPSADPPATSGAGRGRFAMFYGSRAQGETEAFFNVAVFRDFVPGDAPAQDPADIEYFYGRFIDAAGNSVDFVETAVSADVCDAPGGAAEEPGQACFENDAVADQDESFRFVTLFINGGLGRAEASVSGGDLESAMSMTECWDPGLDRTFLQLTSGDDSVQTGACQAPTDQPMSALELPSLATLDAEVMQSLTCAAEHGVSGCP